MCLWISDLKTGLRPRNSPEMDVIRKLWVSVAELPQSVWQTLSDLRQLKQKKVFLPNFENTFFSYSI